MSPEQLIHISSTLLVVAFFIYFAAAFSFVISVIGKNWSNRDANTHKKQWGTLGVTVTLSRFCFSNGIIYYEVDGTGACSSE